MTTPTLRLSPSRAILVLGFGVLVTHGFGMALLPAMLPRIAADFGVGYDALGLVVAAGMVGYAVGAMVSGRLMATVPTRALLLASYTATAIGLALTAMASSAVGIGAAAAVAGMAAPMSWNATLRVATQVVTPTARTLVMAGASGGASGGILLNGVLVQTSGSLHSWRLSFALAAAAAALAIAVAAGVIGTPIESPAQPRVRGGVRRVLTDPLGRMAIAAPLMAGVVGFTFNAFLTATAIDELEVSDLTAAALWWVIGAGGLLAAPVFGRFGQRLSPVRALAVAGSAFAFGLGVLVGWWSYAGLVVAAIGYTVMNAPLWGLVGSVANERFTPADAVLVVSTGLIGASLSGALGNAVAGAVIENTGSFRSTLSVLTGMMVLAAAWYWTIDRGVARSAA